MQLNQSLFAGALVNESSASIHLVAPQALIHAWLTGGTGSATVTVLVSSDPAAGTSPSTASWVPHATLSLSSGTPAAFDAITAPWGHVMLTISGISGGASVNAQLSQ